MPASTIPDLIRLRLLVAYLGEKKQFGWWDCGFLDATGRDYLQRPFPRTAFHAALRSTTAAAVSVHDQAIGRVGAYHLFRLPVEHEEMVDIQISSAAPDALSPLIASRDAALAALESLAAGKVPAATGPVQIGLEKQISSAASVGSMAAHYLAAFKAETKAYPYFAKEKHA